MGVQSVRYNQCGCSKEHNTASVVCVASGDVLPVRLVYKGTRNIAATKLNARKQPLLRNPRELLAKKAEEVTLQGQENEFIIILFLYAIES